MNFFEWALNKLWPQHAPQEVNHLDILDREPVKRPITEMKAGELGYTVNWAISIVDGQTYLDERFQVSNTPCFTSAVCIIKTSDPDFPYLVDEDTAFNHGIERIGSPGGCDWPRIDKTLGPLYKKCRLY